jgi:DNA adenine methylase
VSAPTRPLLRWHGGKWRLAPWIIGHFPAHRIYVEPFGGAASVLLRKPRASSEIYNDLDDDVVNLFAVLRGGRAAEFLRMLRLTPFARSEFELSYEATDDPLERARRLVIRSYMGFGSDSAHTTGNTGFRVQSPRSNRSPEGDWANYPDKLNDAIDRLRGVAIECRPASQIIGRHDSAETLFYVDPPYLPETRSTKSRKGGAKYHAYRHELDETGHADLLDQLRGLAGMVVLSGYPAPFYDDALVGWERVERKALADGARERTEVLWLNPATMERLGEGPLFEAAA